MARCCMACTTPFLRPAGRRGSQGPPQRSGRLVVRARGPADLVVALRALPVAVVVQVRKPAGDKAAVLRERESARRARCVLGRAFGTRLSEISHGARAVRARLAGALRCGARTRVVSGRRAFAAAQCCRGQGRTTLAWSKNECSGHTTAPESDAAAVLASRASTAPARRRRRVPGCVMSSKARGMGERGSRVRARPRLK